VHNPRHSIAVNRKRDCRILVDQLLVHLRVW
jgi:hypothetical protein